MRKRAAVLLLIALPIASVAPPALASPGPGTLRLCVGAPPCLGTLQEALDGAAPGAEIRLPAGTYPGGMTIVQDVTIVGAGAGRTVLEGGGPVLTIGVDGATDPPVVSLRGVTITGGRTTYTFVPELAFGGGVFIPAGMDGSVGATVTFTDSVISGNSARPGGTADCGFPCSFALGGGIFNSGRLTLLRTAVVSNTAGSGSHTFGGGIFNDWMAELTVDHSTIRDNRSSATGDIGRVAESGGIHDSGAMTMRSSSVVSNVSEQESRLTLEEDHVANAGGISVNGSAVITDSVIRDNLVSSTNQNPDGFTNAFGGGIVAKGELTILRSVITRNKVRVNSAGQGQSEAGGLSVDTVTVHVGDSVISDNTAFLTAGGAGQASGGGVLSLGNLTLDRSVIRGNSVRADVGGGDMPWGEPSIARGGGVVNLVDTDPPVLVLRQSSVTGNVVTASTGVTRSGGGIYSLAPMTLTQSVVARNLPDQCFGCG